MKDVLTAQDNKAVLEFDFEELLGQLTDRELHKFYNKLRDYTFHRLDNSAIEAEEYLHNIRKMRDSLNG